MHIQHLLVWWMIKAAKSALVCRLLPIFDALFADMGVRLYNKNDCIVRNFIHAISTLLGPHVLLKLININDDLAG